jgi:multisubunit Na+/H+ antiporter MnhG subunit
MSHGFAAGAAILPRKFAVNGGMHVASYPGVNRHFLGISVYLILAVGLVFLAVVMDWLWLAFAVLISAPVIGAVMATAFMRAKGRSPEHHPPVDRYVNDSDP